MASYQYVYVMKDLTKAFPGGREVFKGITLSFLPGVKIGVLGVNGAGKSTLMKIMAGIETEYGGEAWAAPGATVGYLAQEPPLDPTKTVGENVEDMTFHDAHLYRFNQHGTALPAADTFGGDAALGAEPLHRVDEMQHDAIAAAADGMTEADGAAIDIELGTVD